MSPNIKYALYQLAKWYTENIEAQNLEEDGSYFARWKVQDCSIYDQIQIER